MKHRRRRYIILYRYKPPSRWAGTQWVSTVADYITDLEGALQVFDWIVRGSSRDCMDFQLYDLWAGEVVFKQFYGRSQLRRIHPVPPNGSGI